MTYDTLPHARMEPENGALRNTTVHPKEGYLGSMLVSESASPKPIAALWSLQASVARAKYVGRTCKQGGGCFCRHLCSRRWGELFQSSF